MTTSFVGKLAGITYTDTAAFEKAADALGYLPNHRRRTTWKLGATVRPKVNGIEVEGQVWARHPQRGCMWVALDDGTYAAVTCATSSVFSIVKRTSATRRPA